MRVHFGTGLMQILQRCARELELPAWFKADGLTFHVHGNDVTVLNDWIPAKSGQPVEHRFHACRARVRDRHERIQVETELLVLGADQPVLLSLQPLSM